MSVKDDIDLTRLPQHVAVIMDGNGRWAKEHGRARVYGHKHGVQSVRETTESAAELGIPWLTLYAFSTENWSRPQLEISALMSLLVETLRKEIETLNKNNIRLQAIGDVEKLPRRTYAALQEGIENTSGNTRMTLTLALNYSARWEITHTARKIAEEVQNGMISAADITEEYFASRLTTGHMPDPELLIRTSGERRISNYLLWQIAYAELYFSPVFWPDFRKEHFYQALVDFQHRERRFGMTSEQVLTTQSGTTRDSH